MKKIIVILMNTKFFERNKNPKEIKIPYKTVKPYID